MGPETFPGNPAEQPQNMEAVQPQPDPVEQRWDALEKEKIELQEMREALKDHEVSVKRLEMVVRKIVEAQVGLMDVLDGKAELPPEFEIPKLSAVELEETADRSETVTYHTDGRDGVHSEPQSAIEMDQGYRDAATGV